MVFNNWKKAIQKFNSHEASHTHQEATMKWLALGKRALPERLNVLFTGKQEKTFDYTAILFTILITAGLSHPWT